MNRKADVFPGAKIGAWTVMEACEGEGPRRWRCRCDCGTERSVLENSLRYGGSMSCGCIARKTIAERSAHSLDGQRFGSLTVLEQAPPQDKRRGRWWKCRCDCGAEIFTPGTLLVTGCKTHCGCRKKEHDQLPGSFLPRVAGTSIDYLRSKRVPRNNTSGVKGVYLNQGKYEAKIVFQKKQYWLGRYDLLADAAEARREAEEMFNDQVTAFYDRWKARADADPQWAAENPVQISVERKNGRLEISMEPEI